MTQTRYLIAAALLWRHDHILLVHQQGPDDSIATWGLPGGVVEDGELLTEALACEVREETGLEVVRVGPLAYVAQLDHPAAGYQSLACVFEIEEWRGALRRGALGSEGTDALILSAEFCPRWDALHKLESLPWPVMRDPLRAYLQGPIECGSVWLYREQGGLQTRVATTPAP